MRKLAIVADDLASAMDCGIQVAKSGLQTLVPLSGYEIAAAADAADVVSIDTDSRSVPAGEAYERVKRAAGLMVAVGFPNIYKSVDSTLRGNLGAEVDAVLDVFHVDLAVVAPAYPLYGRTTVGGKHFLHGEPINKTEFATDPQCPVREANLVRLLSSQSKRKTGLVELGVLREGDASVARQLAALTAQKTHLIVFDAQVETDLDRIARAVSATGYRVLWVGSTGLARCIPSALGIQSQDGPRPKHSSATDRIMLVVGSASEITHEQLQTLKQQREVVAVEMNPFRVIAGADAAAVEMERCRSRLVDALNGGSDVVLHVTSSRRDVSVAQSLGHAAGLTAVEVSAQIADALAHITRLVVEMCDLRGIVLTGGDTAKAVCAQLGAIGISIWQEVEPGIPLGRLVGEHEMLIVTKAGAFGTPQALIRSLEAMKKNAQFVET